MAAPTKITLDPESPAFDTPDQAASALADKFKSDKDAVLEKAGVLFKGPDGKFRYSTSIQGQDDRFALAAQVPQGHQMAGIVHSHPGKDREGQVFSPNDVGTAEQLKVPSFVRFLNDGSTRKYTPGKTKTQKMSLAGNPYAGVKVAQGDPLDEPPTAPPAAPAQDAQGGGLLTQATQVNVQGQELTGANMADPTGINNPNPSVGLQSPTTTPVAPQAVNLSDLQSKMPDIAAVAPSQAQSTPSATAQQAGTNANAQAQNATSQDYSAAALGDGLDSTNSATQLDQITAENSPYMQLARNQGMLTAASRGLGNSSIAAGSSEASAVAAAAPLAQQNAAEAATAAGQNAQLGTQVSEQNAQLGTQANEFNTSENVASDQLNAQLGTQTSQYNAGQAEQEAEFNAQQRQQSDQANQQATVQTTQQVMQQNADLNKQYLSGTQAQDLATIQGQYNDLIASNQAASNLYQSYLTSIGTAMANKDIDPARIAQDIAAQQAMLSSGLALINSMNGGNPVTGGTGGAGGSPAMPGITLGANGTNTITPGGGPSASPGINPAIGVGPQTGPVGPKIGITNNGEQMFGSNGKL